MASVIEGAEPTADEVGEAQAPRVVLSLGRLPLAPHGADLYAITGGLELGRVTEETMQRLVSARALIVNAAEASALTDEADLEAAAVSLATRVRPRSSPSEPTARSPPRATASLRPPHRKSTSWMRRARATCSWLPTCGPTCGGPGYATGSHGHPCTRGCRRARPRPSPVRCTSMTFWPKGDRAGSPGHRV